VSAESGGMGREARLYAVLVARLRYRAAHPLRTLALLVAMACVSMVFGAAAPAHSALRDSPHQVCGQVQMP
jgi:hypothetical protein